MKAPIKRMQNKFRFQVLMRIESDCKEILDKVFYASDKYKTNKIGVYLEINSIISLEGVPGYPATRFTPAFNAPSAIAWFPIIICFDII